MTQVMEDYLEAIYDISKEKPQIHVRDIARRLKVKMPSVVKALTELKRIKYVAQKPYGDVTLTVRGRTAGSVIRNRHNQLREFLLLIGVSARAAEKDACRIEHVITAETMDKVRDFIKAKAKEAKAKEIQ